MVRKFFEWVKQHGLAVAITLCALAGFFGPVSSAQATLWTMPANTLDVDSIATSTISTATPGVLTLITVSILLTLMMTVVMLIKRRARGTGR